MVVQDMLPASLQPYILSELSPAEHTRLLDQIRSDARASQITFKEVLETKEHGVTAFPALARFKVRLDLSGTWRVHAPMRLFIAVGLQQEVVFHFSRYLRSVLWAQSYPENLELNQH